jgi:TatD DNase family protein
VIDSHTHLDYADEPADWIARALAVGVHGMVSVGCGAESIRGTLEIARAHPDHVRVAAGVHPQMAAAFDMSTFDEVAELAADPLVVAIGETGFDQFRAHGTLAQQDPAFDAQCELARALGKPLVIHSRAAEEHTLAALDEHAADVDVILHCFALVQPDHLAVVLEHERWVCSFAGNLTYPSAQELRDAAAAIPFDRLMVETDAPYLAPKPMRGKPNEPSYVQHTLQVLAETKGVGFDEARAATTATAERVFGWVPAGAASHD